MYTYEWNEQTITVKIEKLGDNRYHITVADRGYDVDATELSNGRWLIQNDDERCVTQVASSGQERFVHVDGKHFSLTVSEGRISRRKQSGSAGDLKAQMPGQVVDVLVNEGDTVERNQTLVILEAMKMEIRVNAPVDGSVKRVMVNQGDVVERGQLLVEMAMDGE